MFARTPKLVRTIAAAAFVALASGSTQAWAQRVEITCEPGTGRAYTTWSQRPSSNEDAYWSDDSVHFSLRFQIDFDTDELNLFSQDEGNDSWRQYLADDDLAQISAIEGDGPDTVQIMILGASPGSNEVLTITGVQKTRANLTMVRTSIIGAASVSTMLASSCRVRPWRE